MREVVCKSAEKLLLAICPVRLGFMGSGLFLQCCKMVEFLDAMLQNGRTFGCSIGAAGTTSMALFRALASLVGSGLAQLRDQLGIRKGLRLKNTRTVVAIMSSTCGTISGGPEARPRCIENSRCLPAFLRNVVKTDVQNVRLDLVPEQRC